MSNRELRFILEENLSNIDEVNRLKEKYDNGEDWFVDDYFLLDRLPKIERIRKKVDSNSDSYYYIVGEKSKKEAFSIYEDIFKELRDNSKVFTINKYIISVIDLKRYKMCLEEIVVNKVRYIAAEIEVNNEIDELAAKAEALNFFMHNHLRDVNCTNKSLFKYFKRKG